MLEGLYGNQTIEKLLWYLDLYAEGYATSIAKTCGIPLTTVQNSLNRLEAGGILSSTLIGKTRVYEFNPRWPFLSELRSLLRSSYSALSDEERARFLQVRKRPRRKGKPL